MATNQKNFKKDIKLELKFHRQLKAILGNQFIVQDRIADLESGTDFQLFEIKPFTIGARLRRHEFYLNNSFRVEFTIRWERPSGVKTEIHKIRERLVDYIIYGFINKEEDKIVQYFIGDLEIFRNTNAKPIVKNNNPPDSKLAIYKINQFPDNFVIKRYGFNHGY